MVQDNKKILTEHLKERVGDSFGASQEIRELFEATGMLSLKKTHKANIFSINLRNQIKPKIKNGTIRNIKELDRVIDASLNPKKPDKRDEIIYKSLKGTISYTIERYGKKVGKTVKKHNHNWDKASKALAGGLLYGTSGAIAGAALAGEDKGPTYKRKVTNIDFTFPKSYIKILSDTIKIRPEKMKSWSIFFYEIQSIRLLEESKSFELFEIIMKDNTQYIFKSDSNLQYIPKKFEELQSSLDKYKSKSSTTVKPKPLTSQKSQQDPINQIKKLGELRDSGLITNEEFESKKKELLNKI